MLIFVMAGCGNRTAQGGQENVPSEPKVQTEQTANNSGASFETESQETSEPVLEVEQEQNNPSARPGISGNVENMEDYDTIILGYPIWHGQAPRIISTFLESYDFSGKTLLPFSTSHSSGIGSSADNLHALCPDSVKWLDGKRFEG